ncbi:hypothetical protein AY606_08255 [Acinetobacter sp. SFB]|uniref:hypothetical protein n=1 Tax=Acinetobacter sp. SFB TaxID=1805634 RepID=UPI0007D7749A|nr:hypothetical protein [Acinetobacter sp. SFB]OAL78416.1 hypothetical protein AY606_08255 [Acinetobacter sp. SFB]
MTTHLFPFLSELPPPAIFFIDEHRAQIFAAQNLNGSLSLLTAIQLLVDCVSDSNEIQKYSESQLVVEYVNALIKIKSDLKGPKNTIEIELNKLGIIDKAVFLADLDSYDFKSIKTLQEWINFLKKFSNYKIHSRTIRKLGRKINPEIQDNLDLISKRDQAEKARQLIYQILNLISEEERKRLLNIEKGRKGLKDKIKKIIINNGDYKKYFDSNDKTFSNRWSEVLPKIKQKHQK